MPRLKGILETVLYVDDLERARAFYEGVLGLKAAHADERMCAFEVVPDQALLVFKRGQTLDPVELPGGTIPPHDGQGDLHMAFVVEKDEMRDWEALLGEKEVPVESTLDWRNGGRSVYFRDPDGNLLELATPGLWRRR
ncbi:VOC family protein [Lutibaculum baratangense]|uniref:Lactoylglutathione lyase n=1 Tax=Lutibaculum baratangense AMV1 TaxID=631454 RepID=V4TME2_9HYPH|nr:VOC family protein [Lutibaculum baratangense]ESR26908.1 Lactoylglutathione lyase [Lutibaculum baratangense AMV1]